MYLSCAASFASACRSIRPMSSNISVTLGAGLSWTSPVANIRRNSSCSSSLEIWKAFKRWPKRWLSTLSCSAIPAPRAAALRFSFSTVSSSLT